MKKKLFCVLLLASILGNLIMSNADTANADTSDADKDKIDSSMFLEEDILSNQSCYDEIYAYLHSKLEYQAETAMISEQSTNLDILRNIQNRAECFDQFEARLDVEFNSVDISMNINGIIEQDADSVTLSVYEWTDIQYYASDDADMLDEMGYGTEHIMTFEKVGNELHLIRDSFDEQYVTGAHSSDIVVENQLSFDLTDESSSEAGILLLSDFDVQDAIDYANRWCGILVKDSDYENGKSTSGQHDSFYNKSVYVTQSADCANFVSQCLVAGGLSTDSTWKPYSVPWVRASALADYLISIGYPSVSADSTTIFPGNPVYWKNPENSSSSGHQMICTGYNSAGTPVVNAHNSDVFRIPYTNYTKSHNLKTIQIVSSDQHTHDAVNTTIYSYDAWGHYMICKYCQNEYYVGKHQVVDNGISVYCRLCEYTGPFFTTMQLQN